MQNRIREALSIRNIKQIELCKKTGIHKGSVNNWLSQRWQPKQEALVKMAKVLQVNEMWLAGYDVPMEGDIKDEYILKIQELTNELEMVKFRRKKEILEAVCLLSEARKEITKLSGNDLLIGEIEEFIEKLMKD